MWQNEMIKRFMEVILPKSIIWGSFLPKSIIFLTVKRKNDYINLHNINQFTKSNHIILKINILAYVSIFFSGVLSLRVKMTSNAFFLFFLHLNKNFYSNLFLRWLLKTTKQNTICLWRIMKMMLMLKILS